MSQAFICDAVRTPFGRYGGALSSVRTDDLGALPIKALMERNPGVDWAAVDDVLYGNANQAGEDNRNVARMSALLAGLPIAVPGGSFFHHADSFAMMRGGHLDICVLGAFQVSATGDLANWSTGEPGAIPAVGGAMDLAVGAKSTWVMMDLLSKTGECKVVKDCSYPLTGLACVKRIYTDLCTLACTPTGLRLIDTVPGLAHAELERLVGLPIQAND